MKAPFPYFGGKTRVASIVWDALGQPKHYIEPFCGSCAVLLLRPNWTPDMTETVNIANVWERKEKTCKYFINVMKGLREIH